MSGSEKIDLYKLHKHEYAAPKEPVILTVQMLHVGPYDEEPRTVAQMRAFAEAEGLAFRGRHHEIYLSDPRRVEPERLKTILRMPVA